MANLSNPTNQYLKRRENLQKFLANNEEKVKAAKIELDLLNKLIAVSGQDSGNGYDTREGSYPDQILSAMQANDSIWSVSEFKESLGLTQAQCGYSISRLIQSGLIKRVERGKYQLTLKGRDLRAVRRK